MRLNVSLTAPDPALALVEAKIAHPSLVDGAQGQQQLSELVARNLGCALDLISHSKGGVLQFRTWSIDKYEGIGPMLHKQWGAQTPTVLRLLGCSTAHTAAGQAAMRHLANVFKVPIYGTTAAIYASDFDASGFISTGVLISNSNLPDAIQHLSDPVIEAWFLRFQPSAQNAAAVRGDLRVETMAQVQQAQTAMGRSWPLHTLSAPAFDLLFNQLATDAKLAPGLLAIPDGEAIVSVAGGVHRATFLLGGAFVRFYTNAQPDGVLLRSHGPMQLAGGDPVIHF